MSQETLSSKSVLFLPTPARRPRRWKGAVFGVTGFLTFVLLFLWYIGVFGGNVREVEPGRVYRSAQITGRNLERVLDERHIRTMLSLRGGSMQDSWYRSETESCQQRGVKHITLSFSAQKMPPPGELKRLLKTFDTAEYPILFHCRGGADRSGLAGTLYLHLYKKIPLEEAQSRQLTLRYGHVPGGMARAMDDFLDLYRRTKGDLGLRDWIEKKYPALFKELPAEQKGDGDDLSPTREKTPERDHAKKPVRLDDLGLGDLRECGTALLSLGAMA